MAICHLATIFASPNQFSHGQVKRQAAPGSCGKPNVPQKPNPKKNRIIGGVQAAPHSHPWIVSLTFGTHYCGGSLIRVGNVEKTDIVLTAAHCVHGLSAGSLYVTAGAHSLKEQLPGQKTVNIASIAVHQNYDPVTFMNDIAILKLAEAIPFGKTTQPICLPSPAEPLPAEGTEMTVAGWGKLQEDSDMHAKELQQVGIPIVNLQSCNKALASKEYPNPISAKEMFCAGGLGGLDSCQMDSGGPLIYRHGDRYVAHGLVSWGEEGCGRVGKPGAYTRVSNYLAWISEQVKKLSKVA